MTLTSAILKRIVYIIRNAKPLKHASRIRMAAAIIDSTSVGRQPAIHPRCAEWQGRYRHLPFGIFFEGMNAMGGGTWRFGRTR